MNFGHWSLIVLVVIKLFCYYVVQYDWWLDPGQSHASWWYSVCGIWGRDTQNLVSGPKLDIDGFVVSHGHRKLSILYDFVVFGPGILDGGLYRLELDDDFT